MSNPKSTCLKCNGEMVQGFVPDYSYGAILVGTWYEGQPRKSFWTKIKAPSRAEGLPIAAFRCSKCGFLEFYADSKFTAK